MGPFRAWENLAIFWGCLGYGNWRSDRTSSACPVALVYLCDSGSLVNDIKSQNFRVFANISWGLLYIFIPTLPLYTQSKDLFIKKANIDGMFHFLVYFKKLCDFEYTNWSSLFFMFFLALSSILQLLTLAYLEYLVEMTENLINYMNYLVLTLWVNFRRT